jgi:hypothetical protein
MIKYLFLVYIALVLFSCKKDENLLPLSTTPAIKILDISNDTIVEFTEQLKLNLEYEDGDGDLGNKDTDINSLFIKDSRLEFADEYYIAPLAPEGSQISIKGTLNITLSSAFVLGNGTSEKTYFEIWMVDRIGHKSNIVRTKEITILKQ